MIEGYPIQDVAFIIVSFCTTVYSAYKAFDWVNSRFLHLYVSKKDRLELAIDDVKADIVNIDEKLSRYERDIDSLKKASVSRIKQKIVDRHELYMGNGAIDYRSLDCLQQQFKAYKELGGNSYICKLMEDIESLPLRK